MSAGANIKLVLLWEAELRAAGRALAKANETGTNDDWAVAMGACMTALAGVEDDSALVLIAADAIRDLAQKQRPTPPADKGVGDD